MMINVKTAEQKWTAEKHDEEEHFALSMPLCPRRPKLIVLSEIENLMLLQLFKYVGRYPHNFLHYAKADCSPNLPIGPGGFCASS